MLCTVISYSSLTRGTIRPCQCSATRQGVAYASVSRPCGVRGCRRLMSRHVWLRYGDGLGGKHNLLSASLLNLARITLSVAVNFLPAGESVNGPLTNWNRPLSWQPEFHLHASSTTSGRIRAPSQPAIFVRVPFSLTPEVFRFVVANRTHKNASPRYSYH